jgi:hypothetical protein
VAADPVPKANLRDLASFITRDGSSIKSWRDPPGPPPAHQSLAEVLLCCCAPPYSDDDTVMTGR